MTKVTIALSMAANVLVTAASVLVFQTIVQPQVFGQSEAGYVAFNRVYFTAILVSSILNSFIFMYAKGKPIKEISFITIPCYFIMSGGFLIYFGWEAAALLLSLCLFELFLIIFRQLNWEWPLIQMHLVYNALLIIGIFTLPPISAVSIALLGPTILSFALSLPRLQAGRLLIGEPIRSARAMIAGARSAQKTLERIADKTIALLILPTAAPQEISIMIVAGLVLFPMPIINRILISREIKTILSLKFIFYGSIVVFSVLIGVSMFIPYFINTFYGFEFEQYMKLGILICSYKALNGLSIFLCGVFYDTVYYRPTYFYVSLGFMVMFNIGLLSEFWDLYRIVILFVLYFLTVLAFDLTFIVRSIKRPT